MKPKGSERVVHVCTLLQNDVALRAVQPCGSGNPKKHNVLLVRHINWREKVLRNNRKQINNSFQPIKLMFTFDKSFQPIRLMFMHFSFVSSYSDCYFVVHFSPKWLMSQVFSLQGFAQTCSHNLADF